MEPIKFTIGISILNWNAADETIQCVQSLLNSSYTDMQVSVLDNGSRIDESRILRQAITDHRVIIERSERNLGFAGGHNVIMRHFLDLHYPYILLLNQDAHIEVNTIERLLATLVSNAKIAAVGPLVLNPDHSIQSLGAEVSLLTGKVTSRYQGSSITALRDMGNPDSTQPHQVPVIVGNCLLVRSEALRDVGLFDEDYFAYYEEVDWCVRAAQKEWHTIVDPRTNITHDKTGGFRTYLIVRNMIWFMYKQANWLQLIIFFMYFWGWFVWERLKKGSPFKELWRAAYHGWLRQHTGTWPN